MLEPKHATLKPGQLWIGGEWTEAASGRTFETVNPATEAVLTRVAEAGPEDVHRAVFPKGRPRTRAVAQLKAGIRRYIKKHHARG